MRHVLFPLLCMVGAVLVLAMFALWLESFAAADCVARGGEYQRIRHGSLCLKPGSVIK